jgi:hypothetical protein
MGPLSDRFAPRVNGRSALADKAAFSAPIFLLTSKTLSQRAALKIAQTRPGRCSLKHFEDGGRFSSCRI